MLVDEFNSQMPTLLEYSPPVVRPATRHRRRWAWLALAVPSAVVPFVPFTCDSSPVSVVASWVTIMARFVSMTSVPCPGGGTDRRPSDFPLESPPAVASSRRPVRTDCRLRDCRRHRGRFPSGCSRWSSRRQARWFSLVSHRRERRLLRRRRRRTLVRAARAPGPNFGPCGHAHPTGHSRALDTAELMVCRKPDQAKHRGWIRKG